MSCFKVLSRFIQGWALNDNHPVLQSMLQELQVLRGRYADQPCEFNRYQVVRQEARVSQVRPDLLLRV